MCGFLFFLKQSNPLFSTSKLVEMATPSAALSEEDKEKNTHRALGAGGQGRPPAFAGRGRRWGEAWGGESFQVPSSALPWRARACGAWRELGSGAGAELPRSARSAAVAWWLPSRLPLALPFSPHPAGRGLAGGLCSSGRRARCPSALECQRTGVPGPNAAQRRRAGEEAAAAAR